MRLGSEPGTALGAAERDQPPRRGAGGVLSVGPWRHFTAYGALLIAAYSGVFLNLYHFTRANDLYSYVAMVPAISVYLVWIRRRELPAAQSRLDYSFGGLCSVLGLTLLTSVWLARRAGWSPPPQDVLWLQISSFVALLIAGGFFFLGRLLMAQLLLPSALLLWLAPLPAFAEAGIERFLQTASAAAASILFTLSGAPAVREGLFFHIPGIVLEVARECSGIRSSLVLFIVSWAAGYLFLRRAWTRVVLAGFVVPLAIVRNGFRIFTIGMLCAHGGPAMIDSWVHRRGGPFFFALSLIPFALLLLGLRWREQRPQTRRP